MPSSMTTGALLDGADAEDRQLRLVDDRHPELGAEGARVGDREGAAVHLLVLELLGAGARGEVDDAAAQVEQVALLGAMDHRHDQAPVERDGDAEVDVLRVDDRVALVRGVQDRRVLQRLDHRLGDERQEGELDAGLLVVVLLRLAQPIDVREVDLEHRVHVGRRAPGCSTMCSAIFLRITLNGATAVRSPSANAGAGPPIGACGAAVRGSASPEPLRRGWSAADAAFAPPSITRRMSCLVTRPPMPEPGIEPMST